MILIGLSFLALEFERAERLLERAIVWADGAKNRAEEAARARRRSPPRPGWRPWRRSWPPRSARDIPLLPV